MSFLKRLYTREPVLLAAAAQAVAAFVLKAIFDLDPEALLGLIASALGTGVYARGKVTPVADPQLGVR